MTPTFVQVCALSRRGDGRASRQTCEGPRGTGEPDGLWRAGNKSNFQCAVQYGGKGAKPRQQYLTRWNGQFGYNHVSFIFSYFSTLYGRTLLGKKKNALLNSLQ